MLEIRAQGIGDFLLVKGDLIRELLAKNITHQSMSPDRIHP